jgi:dihydrofolate reductase
MGAMTRTLYYTATTLDGYLADEHDSLDWLMKQPEPTDDGPLGYGEFIAGIGALCMGATTYEWVLAHHDGPWPYDQPTWVFTHRDLPRTDGDVRFARGDVVGAHAEMVAAAEGKDVWCVGGGDLAGQLADDGLLDRLLVSIAPVTLGAGRPLFPRRWDLRLVDLGRNGAFACATYDVLGPLASA